MEIRGQIPTLGLADGIVTLSDDVITGVRPADTTSGDAGDSGEIILPGLIDIHCHGGGGHTFTTTDPGQARAVTAHHAARGTTRIMASLVTAAADVLLAQVEALAPLVASGDLLGIHLEGPFLSGARCGAQSPEFIIDPDPALAKDLLSAANGTIKVVTIAPERPGASALADLFRSAGVTVALGHTDADYDTMASGLASLSGTALVTHLANGMPPLHHRSAGPAAAALVAAADDEASVELIADGVHVDTGFTRLVFATTAPGRVVLITDAMAAAGMADGSYELGPMRAEVSGGVARLAPAPGEAAGSGSIAGGTSSLIEVVATAHAAGVPLADAAAAASAAPARALGLPGIGSITAGAPADLVLTGPDLRVRRVLRGGEWIETAAD
jgi:N-acetylglucosamine-6-phosphate deacetylase